MNFYEREINRIESNDKLREFDKFINEYIESNNKDLTNTLKELIISKAKNELSQNEMRAFRDNLSHRASKETWNNKLKLYELIAWLYNISESKFNERIWNIDINDTPVFEVSWWNIERNYRTINLKWKIKKKQKIYTIVWSEVKHLWDRMYEINLIARDSKGRNHNETVLIRYRWWNTVEVFDHRRPSRSLGIVPIRNKSKTVEMGRIRPDWRYDRIIEERNSFIDFYLDDFWTKVHLEMVFNDR